MIEVKYAFLFARAADARLPGYDELPGARGTISAAKFRAKVDVGSELEEFDLWSGDKIGLNPAIIRTLDQYLLHLCVTLDEELVTWSAAGRQ